MRSRGNPDTVYDRTARLIIVLALLNGRPRGLTIEQIAERCGVSTRTIRRDLIALEETFKAKFTSERGRWILLPGTLLPPIMFTPPEAMAIFMACRLMVRQQRVYNRDIEAVFTKISAVVPPPLKEEIDRALKRVKRGRPDSTAVTNLNTLSQCWLDRRRASIRYRGLNAKSAEARVIEPYYIQQAATENALYILAYCCLKQELRTFRLDRIVEARALDETYEIPDTFDPNEYFGKYWSVTTSGEPRIIRLRFHPKVAQVASETQWHDSQVTQTETDGSAVVTMKVALTRDVESFILGWADMVEVLSPAALKRQVADAARKINAMYEERDAAAAQRRGGKTAYHKPEEVEEVDARQLGLWREG